MRRSGLRIGNAISSIVLAGVLLAGFCSTTPVEAQSGNQTNTVNVKHIQNVNPPNDASVTTDEYDTDNSSRLVPVAESNTSWQLISNSTDGAQVTFSASDFNHGDENIKRPIKFTVKKGTKDWDDVSTGSDATETASGGSSSITVESDNFPSYGTVELETWFKHKDKDEGPNGNQWFAPQGTYTTTITATLSKQ